MIVAELAEALGLRVPARSLVILAADTPSDDKNDELADLLAASVGENLGFAPQYDWRAVTEATPRAAGTIVEPHLFEAAAASDAWAALDARLASLLTRPVLEHAVAVVPASFLTPLLAAGAPADSLRRRRAAYAAFLWKRLKAPRAFRDAAPAPARPRAPPHRTYPPPPRRKPGRIPED